MSAVRQILPVKLLLTRSKTKNAEHSITVLYNSRGERLSSISVFDFCGRYRTSLDARRFVDCINFFDHHFLMNDGGVVRNHISGCLGSSSVAMRLLRWGFMSMHFVLNRHFFCERAWRICLRAPTDQITAENLLFLSIIFWFLIVTQFLRS